MILKQFFNIRNPTDHTSVSTFLQPFAQSVFDGSADAARKLSAVDACIEILSNSIGKLPAYVVNKRTRDRVPHDILYRLNTRPNEAMTPFVRKKMLEISRLEGGNAYDWIVRNPATKKPEELIPIPYQLVTPWRDTRGEIWYRVIHPYTQEPMDLPNEDVCHYKGSSRNGLVGQSVLARASEVISGARAAQEYGKSFYLNGGRPDGVLQTDADLSGVVQDPKDPSKTIAKKDILRGEWEKIHSGPSNSHRIAILDYGLKYTPMASTNADAQFVQDKEIGIRDIARFFGVPLYKLQEGKQAYGSNEQNAIEYVVGTLHPICTQYEEEMTYKLLMKSDIDEGLEIGVDMMAELKGDTTSRANWYKSMREIGAYRVNDIRMLEDMPDIPGGEHAKASLNDVPLEYWPDLSLRRNGGDTNSNN